MVAESALMVKEYPLASPLPLSASGMIGIPFQLARGVADETRAGNNARVAVGGFGVEVGLGVEVAVGNGVSVGVDVAVCVGVAVGAGANVEQDAATSESAISRTMVFVDIFFSSDLRIAPDDDAGRKRYFNLSSKTLETFSNASLT